MSLFTWFRRKSPALALALSISAAAHTVAAAPKEQRVETSVRNSSDNVSNALDKLHFQGRKLLKRYDAVFLSQL